MTRDEQEMIYEEIAELPREEIERVLRSGKAEKVSLALLSAALYSDDEEWATGLCVGHLASEHDDVVRCALIGLSHIVRIHENIDFDIGRVEEEISRIGLERSHKGYVEDLRRDFRVYIIGRHGLQ